MTKKRFERHSGITIGRMQVSNGSHVNIAGGDINISSTGYKCECGDPDCDKVVKGEDWEYLDSLYEEATGKSRTSRVIIRMKGHSDRGEIVVNLAKKGKLELVFVKRF